MAASGQKYSPPDYRAGASDAWYHFLFGHVPGYQIDWIISPKSDETVKRVHTAWLRPLLTNIAPVAFDSPVFAIANLSLYDMRHGTDAGALALLYGVRFGDLADHAGRPGVYFGHAALTVGRAWSAQALTEAGQGFASRAEAHATAFYPGYYGDGWEAHDSELRPRGEKTRIPGYLSQFARLASAAPGPPPGPAYELRPEVTDRPSRILVLINGEQVSRDEQIALAAGLTALLLRSNLPWVWVTQNLLHTVAVEPEGEPGQLVVHLVREALCPPTLRSQLKHTLCLPAAELREALDSAPQRLLDWLGLRRCASPGAVVDPGPQASSGTSPRVRPGPSSGISGRSQPSQGTPGRGEGTSGGHASPQGRRWPWLLAGVLLFFVLSVLARVFLVPYLPALFDGDLGRAAASDAGLRGPPPSSLDRPDAATRAAELPDGSLAAAVAVADGSVHNGAAAPPTPRSPPSIATTVPPTAPATTPPTTSPNADGRAPATPGKSPAASVGPAELKRPPRTGGPSTRHGPAARSQGQPAAAAQINKASEVDCNQQLNELLNEFSQEPLQKAMKHWRSSNGNNHCLKTIDLNIDAFMGQCVHSFATKKSYLQQLMELQRRWQRNPSAASFDKDCNPESSQ